MVPFLLLHRHFLVGSPLDNIQLMASENDIVGCVSSLHSWPYDQLSVLLLTLVLNDSISD